MIKFEGKKRNVFFCSNSCVYGTCGKLHSMILFNNKKGHTVPIHLGSCCAPANPAQEAGYLGVNS